MYIDLLTKIKNAQAVRKDSVKTIHTKGDESIAVLLEKKGYIDGFEVRGKSPKKILEVRLKYEEGIGAIRGVKFLSTPSRRIRFGYAKILPVKNGYGSLLLSTSKGIMTGEEAKRNKIGGEALFKIW